MEWRHRGYTTEKRDNDIQRIKEKRVKEKRNKEGKGRREVGGPKSKKEKEMEQSD